MTAYLLLALLPLGQVEPHRLVVKVDGRPFIVVLKIESERGPLAASEAELLRGWKPSEDGDDPLDRLAPEGRLLRLEQVAPSSHSALLTRALFSALDMDKDGKISRAEAMAAEKTLLSRFDADGDGCLTALEIVPGLLNAAPMKQAARPDVRLLHPRQKPASDAKPLFPDAVALRFGEASHLRRVRGGVRFEFASLPRVASSMPTLPKLLMKAGLEKARERFEQVAQEVATLVVSSQPRGWFELLDANGDGQLSMRELRGLWSRLADDQKADFLALPNFGAPTLSVTLTPGTSARPAVMLTPAPLPTRGPVWFQAMDKNRDGDVSRAEFLGDDAEFRAYDADGDGLISVEEAEAGDQKLKAKGRS